MKQYSKEKRNLKDFCNICGTKTSLSWDHVPPKACLNSIPVKFNNALDGIPRYNDFKNISQNGIRFRSICSACNNGLLGSEYDPELVRFTSEVVEVIQQVSSDSLFDMSSLVPCTGSFKINKIARAVCGHILAAKNEYDNQTNVDRKIREFFLNPTAVPPKEFKLYFWFYPYQTITIARDFVAKKVQPSSATVPDGISSILSSFPIAYCLSEGNRVESLPNMFDFCDENIEKEVVVKFDFKTCFLETGELRHPLWPVYVSDDDGGVDMVLASKHTVTSSVIGIRELKI